MHDTSCQAAQQVLQQAIAALLGDRLSNGCKPNNEMDEFVGLAKKVLRLTDANIDVLLLLFDRINLDDFATQDRIHYAPLQAIANTSSGYPLIPYPSINRPSAEDLENYQRQVANEVTPYLGDRWNDLNFLCFVLEKYGACVSYGDRYVALVDAARMTAAVAAVLAKNPQAQELSLIAGDLSGIQKFIYTISSDGALKSLRARSFYLELVTEEVVQQVLHEFQLPRTNLIYAGGGKLFVLAGDVGNNLKSLQQNINKWLKDSFQGKISLALDSETCNIPDVETDTFNADFRSCWKAVSDKLDRQKERKFENSINDLLKQRNSHQPCKVCHRDDIKPERLKSLHDESDVLACPTCRRMFRIGRQLFRVRAFIRSNRSNFMGSFDHLNLLGRRYYLFENIPDPATVQSDETLFLINDWELEHYNFANPTLMLLGNYSQRGEEGFITAEEMTVAAAGIPRVGYLRMDVDRLGQIFANGLTDAEYSLPRVAGLSRQMSYFFKVYLNSLAGDRQCNFLNYRQDKGFEVLTDGDRQNLMFIYAGGDDLFISGAWNEVAEFAFDVYQSFQAYTGQNSSITISGGISIEDAKFPLYQAASLAGEAEHKAKDNDRDSLGLFAQAFKWEEWFGKDAASIVAQIRKSDTTYWQSERSSPPMAGIFPFVTKLKDNEGNYSRSFVRNLLKTAQLQEQKLKEIGDRKGELQYKNEEKDIRYYLHLPQIAYTLARLQGKILKDDDFDNFRQSLKSPYNAPYFRAIATWIELLNRSNKTHDRNY